MVLAAMGVARTERDIAQVLGSYEYGTPSSRVALLSRWGYRVQYGPSSLDQLRAYLDRGLLPIVFARADLLPWTDFTGFHALVLAHMTDTEVALHDPALDAGPTWLARASFLVAWEEFDRLTAIVMRG
jgi:hypothetical protein